MTTANELQVGGDHYQAPYQHWDFVADCRLGYFEGQSTKYLTRHSKKNGLQDVEKGEHFLLKLLELSHQGYVAMNDEASNLRIERFFSAHPYLLEPERQVMLCVAFWSKPKHIEAALAHVKAIKARYAEADAARKTASDRGYGSHHEDPDAHPTPGGYVDQAKDKA